VGAKPQLVRLRLKEALALDADRLAVVAVGGRELVPRDVDEHGIAGLRARPLLPLLEHAAVARRS